MGVESTKLIPVTYPLQVRLVQINYYIYGGYLRNVGLHIEERENDVLLVS